MLNLEIFLHSDFKCSLFLVLKVPLMDSEIIYSIFIGKITMGIPNLKNLFWIEKMV
jgi:hypothetical protein